MVSRTFKHTKRQMARTVLDIVKSEYSIFNIKTKSRVRNVVDARKIYTRYLRENKNRSFKEIGDYFNATHASAIYLYNNSDWLVNHDEKGKRIWKLINKASDQTKRETEIMNDIYNVFLDIDDIDVYHFALDKLKTIVKAKTETLCMKQ